MSREKIAGIVSRLQDAFPGSIVEDSYADGIYTFRVNLENATRWLHISRTTVEDEGEDSLLRLVDTYQVVEHFKRGARRLLLTPAGVHRVGSDLAKE